MPFGQLDLSHPSLALDMVFLLVGLCVGSFLNVLALRSLSEQSIFWPPSNCPKCHHRLAPYDNIPLVSWLWLRGRCRYCAMPISWQYPAVEAFTAFSFVAVERTFLDLPHSIFNNEFWNHLVASLPPFVTQDNFNGPMILRMGLDPTIAWLCIAGALMLACTLIAVTVTDFREKLIPHEITYPSMIVGILFSALVRHDALGAMAGIGASYIIFDFIAFYGGKFYMLLHGPQDEPAGRPRRLRRRMPPRKRRRLASRLRWRIDLATIDHVQEEQEPFEVMGGGDAVLSAVLSAYLGWQMLVIALFIGFLSGTAMGLALLFGEMKKAKLLHKCFKWSSIAGGIAATVFGLFGLLIQQMTGNVGPSPVASFAAAGVVGGALIGITLVGTKVSKPYPFGPALALGGFIAMFLLPNWLSLH